MRDIAWGAVIFGAVTALAGALLIFLVLGIAGVLDSLGGLGALVFLQYLSFLLAGFIAGRFAPGAHALHGGLSGLVLFGVTAVVAIANAGALPSLLLAGVVAVVIGSAGGALGQWQRERTGGSRASG